MKQNLDIVCLSHLRWGFVYQRPNHIMSRFALDRRVFFIEEPVFDNDGGECIEVVRSERNLFICTPHLSKRNPREADQTVRHLLDTLFASNRVQNPVLWFYTPMALPHVECKSASLVVYDCMDELSAFQAAPKELLHREQQLLVQANVVFTGGASLYEAKRHRHPSVHAFPSSVDASHFRAARNRLADPADQAKISVPRIGFFGVIDERLDLDLLQRVARERPHYQYVLVGPVVKIDPQSLPRLPNVHYLGSKSYAELPLYLSGWDVAMMPFALNEATRFISPTKTLEYLAAGKPVISTAIRDVVDLYGRADLVQIANAETFATAIDRALDSKNRRASHLAKCDDLLAQTSWDSTVASMLTELNRALGKSKNKGESTCTTI
jgi:glycosyltransferase involved in cell wall biosynthesis